MFYTLRLRKRVTLNAYQRRNSEPSERFSPFSQLWSSINKRQLLPVIGLFFCFLWFYGRFAPQLYFVMDDYIETRYNLSKPLWTVIVESFAGDLNWSGYRPLTYAVRALFSHWLRLDYVIGYYLFGFGLHFVNSWLVLHIGKRLFAHSGWAFLAALIFLLLPSHNEALFYMSANASLLGLTFALTMVALALARSQADEKRLYTLGVCLTYALAVLAYEVLLPLPLLLWLLEWRLTGKALSRKQLTFYGALALVAVALLAVRYWAMGQRLTHVRADYAVSLDWFHIARGYVILWGQLMLLHSSAWQNYPLFHYARVWLSPLDRRALVAILFMLGCGISWARWVRRQPDQTVRSPLFWFEWGVAWLYLLSLPFAMLSGRNPENRYVYIPSVGFAFSLTALFSMGYAAVARRPVWRTLMLSLPILLLSFYAYVTTSDGVEWRQASQHTRAFVTQAKGLIADIPPGSQLFQTGMPDTIGGAYLFTTDIALQDAMQWLYANDTLTVTRGHLKLRDYLRSDRLDLTQSYLLAYDLPAYTTRLPAWVEDCATEIACIFYPLATFTPPIAPTPPIVFQEGFELLGHNLAWLYRINHATTEPVLVTCWRLTTPAPADYTFYVHFTDANGATTLAQADHQLRQAYPFTRARITTTGWPLNTPICDLTNLTEAFNPPGGGPPSTVRGGIWVPDNGSHLTPTTVKGYEVDPAGRIIFPVTPAMLQ